MADFIDAGSSESSARTAAPNDQNWDLGPDLFQPNWRQRWKSYIQYALKHQPIQIIIAFIAFLLIVLGVLFWSELHFPLFSGDAAPASKGPLNWTDWSMRIQAVLGFFTLLVAVFVWIGEIHEDWKNDLPKRISVFFFCNDDPLIAIRYAWLAGADDLRNWGQQIAKQAAGNKLLDFRPDVDAKKPNILMLPNGTICMHYEVCFKLLKLNEYLSLHSKECQYQNLAATDKNVRPIPLSQVQALRKMADWRSCPHCGRTKNSS